MKPTKVFLKQAILLSAIFIFLFPMLLHAQVKEIITEGTYNMGDGETPSVAEERALVQAKRVAVEQAGTYVESYTKVKNFQLTEDEIQVLASGIMEVTILEKKRTIVGDGFNFWVKIKAKVNPDKIEEMAKKVKEKSVVEDYKKIQEAYDKSRKDIEELKKQLAQAKNEKEKKQIKTKITGDERLFQANEWFEKGNEYNTNLKGTYLDPNLRKEYTIKGDSKEYNSDKKVEPPNAGKPLKTVQDRPTTPFLSPNATYEDKLKRINQIRLEVIRAVARHPEYAKFEGQELEYRLRKEGLYNIERPETKEAGGIIYERQPDGTWKPVTPAPKEKGVLSPQRKTFYESKYGIELPPDATEDDLKIILEARKGTTKTSIDPNTGLSTEQTTYDDAIEAYTKAIALDPNLAQAYINRGNAYAKKGEKGKAIYDFQKACDLGYQKGCENLQALKKR